MAARIYKPAKTAMQSGTARTRDWVLEFEPGAPREVDPLMGWTSSRDMTSQVRMRFPTKEDAIAYAKRHGIAYRVSEPKPRRRRPKSYADNFRYGRLGSWTH
ncbi:MAG: ETC complex I subunit [Alphaproteobacteria bacterium]|nr:MAG: ETC complex I subunit [Alphaproteobacteria bacterium]